MATPERPPSVPANAVFNPDSSLWEVAPGEERGLRHGAFAHFGPRGELVANGTYVEGRLEGAQSRFSSGLPGGALLRPCCVPPGARELRAHYRAGRLLGEVFHDEHGHPLCEDGTPWPEVPAGVQADAYYEADSARFVERGEHADGSATFRYFKLDGTLEYELDVEAGRARRRRSFGADGTCREETALDGHGMPHGDYVARFTEGERAYVDTRVRAVRGQHEHGERIGVWEFRDAAGARLRSVDHGAVLSAEETASLAGDSNAAPNAAAFWSEAEALFAPSPRLACAKAARALAHERDLARFFRFFHEHCMPLAPDAAEARGADFAVAAGKTPSALLGALVAGAAPGVPLRTLASGLSGHAPAALDYFDASLLLAPEQALVGLGRALLCIEHGEPEGALAAATLAERESADAAEPLRQFCRVTYEAFSFCPARDGVTPPAEELVAIEAAQPLAAVRRAVALYATRLAVVRAELRRRARGTPAWLPPDTSTLAPDGALELRRYSVRIEDEDEDGVEVSQVEVDETLALGVSTRRLLLTARSDWAALGWLCWCAGLDAVALPERLVPRPDFAAAAHQATVRCWRAHDRLRSSGLVALARNVAGFEWEGMPIDRVPTHLVEVVAAEYLAVRAQFLWQLFPQNASPFQSDLMRV